jgi:hypothetical protein
MGLSQHSPALKKLDYPIISVGPSIFYLVCSALALLYLLTAMWIVEGDPACGKLQWNCVNFVQRAEV